MMRLLIVSCMVASSVGCGPSRVDIPRVKPASLELAGIHSIVVGGIDADGTEGELVADALTRQLRSLTPWVVHQRVNVRALLSGRRLWSQTASQQARVGRLHAADAVIVGRLIKSAYFEDYSTYTCRHGSRGDKGRTCFSRRGTSQVDLEFKVVEAATGRVFGTQSLQVVQRTPADEVTLHSAHPHERDPSTLFPKADVQSLRRSAYEEAAKHFAQLVIPHYDSVRVALFTHSQHPDSRMSLARAQQGDWSSALALLRRQAVQTDQESADAHTRARAHYNLGVVQACAGQFDAGILELQQAIALADDPLFSQELQRARGWLREAYQPNQQRLSLQCGRGAPMCTAADTDWMPLWQPTTTAASGG